MIDVSSQLENEVLVFSDERHHRIRVTNATILSYLKAYGIYKFETERYLL